MAPRPAQEIPVGLTCTMRSFLRLASRPKRSLAFAGQKPSYLTTRRYSQPGRRSTQSGHCRRSARWRQANVPSPVKTPTHTFGMRPSCTESKMSTNTVNLARSVESTRHITSAYTGLVVTARRDVIAALCASILLFVVLNWLEFKRPSSCWDCDLAYGLPFTFWRTGGFLHNGRFIWLGVAANLVVLLACGVAASWTIAVVNGIRRRQPSKKTRVQHKAFTVRDASHRGPYQLLQFDIATRVEPGKPHLDSEKPFA